MPGIIRRLHIGINTISKSKMISRRQGEGDEAYVSHATIAYLTGKEMNCFLLCPLWGCTPGSTNVPEADDATNKDSALI
jgi:hypothetical protein